MTTSFSSCLIIGALAGLTATSFMTAMMRRLHARLPREERYPLPPREITERLLPEIKQENALQDMSLLAHFGYGAAAGALIAGADLRNVKSAGPVFGIGIWGLSYFGWVPAFGILKPAHVHPARRNRLMIGAHLLWGGMTGWMIEELSRARQTIMASGSIRDAPEWQPAAFPCNEQNIPNKEEDERG